MMPNDPTQMQMPIGAPPVSAPGTPQQPPPMAPQMGMGGGGGVEAPNPQFTQLLVQRMTMLGPQIIDQFGNGLVAIDKGLLEMLANIVPELGVAFTNITQTGAGGGMDAGATPPPGGGAPNGGMSGMAGAADAGLDAQGSTQPQTASPLVSQSQDDAQTEDDEEEPNGGRPAGRLAGIFPT